MNGEGLRLTPRDLDTFIGKNMYFKRLQNQNGYNSIDEMITNLRDKKQLMGRKYVEYI